MKQINPKREQDKKQLGEKGDPLEIVQENEIWPY